MFTYHRASLAPGLLDVGYRLYNANSTAAGLRITTGITEVAPGLYSANVEYAQNFIGYIVWDSPAYPRVAREDISPGVVTLLKADVEWLELHAASVGGFTFTPPVAYPGAGTLVLKDKAGVTTLATITLQFDANGIVTSKVVA